MAVKYPIFSKDDLNGFWALFADNLANTIIVTAACLLVLKIPPELVFGRVLPGVGMSLLAGLLFYAWLARKLAQKEQRTDVTALPYGISTPVMFAYIFMVMKPVANSAIAGGMSEADAGILAWRVGVAATFLGGIIEALGSLVGPWLKRHLPRAGMLGTLAGIALVWIAAVPLAEIFENPVIGLLSMAVVLVGLVAMKRLPFGIPAGLAAIMLGTVIGLATGQSSFDTSGLGLYVPVPVLGDLWLGLQALLQNTWILAVVVPAEIYNFIETMNNVESAEAAGDSFPVGICQVADGAGTMVGALFGSAFPTTVYIGHPGYKRLGGRMGYALGVGIVFSVGALFGLFTLLNALIPVAAVAPMLVFIGLVIMGQAFTAVPPAHAMAGAMAILPHVSNLLIAKWSSLSTVLTGDPVRYFDPALAAAFVQQGAHVPGHAALSYGAIITGLIWGSVTAFLIDRKPVSAGLAAIAGAILTLFGFIHYPVMGFYPGPIFGGYVAIAVFCGILHLFPGKDDPSAELHVN
jgi:AGZA family xanthine/uracil permease-like MFS transporter